MAARLEEVEPERKREIVYSCMFGHEAEVQHRSNPVFTDQHVVVPEVAMDNLDQPIPLVLLFCSSNLVYVECDSVGEPTKVSVRPLPDSFSAAPGGLRRLAGADVIRPSSLLRLPGQLC